MATEQGQTPPDSAKAPKVKKPPTGGTDVSKMTPEERAAWNRERVTAEKKKNMPGARPVPRRTKPQA